LVFIVLQQIVRVVNYDQTVLSLKAVLGGAKLLLVDNLLEVFREFW
jgi:hypothetical protein